MMDHFKKYLIMNYELFNEHVKVGFIHYLLYRHSFRLELYGHNQLPQICFVVVKKRHNTRFFTWDKQSNQTNNIQPGKGIERYFGSWRFDFDLCLGTVIDTDIVSPNGFDFYLNSHAAIQGTSRPILYQVLYDEIGFTSDDIQQLT